MGNCSKHNVPEYLQDLKKVANDLADMPYDKMVEFLGHLEEKLSIDSENDGKGKRYVLSLFLADSAIKVDELKRVFEKIWKLCKPYMK